MQKHLPYNSKRRKLRANMILSATINDGVRTLDLKATCLGEEGMFLELTAPYPIGTLLDIVLPLPSLNNPLELKGEVVYVIDSSQQNRPPGMGIKFKDLTRNISIQLTSYIESFLSDSRPLSSPVTVKETGNFLSSISTI
jgi:Tfp pilus assembly protein PilZ